MGQHLPFVVGYAKSGRATCRGCKGKIEIQSLRIGRNVMSDSFDGMMELWYHYQCLFHVTSPSSIKEIANFDNIRWNDQEAIKQMIEKKRGPTKNRKRSILDISNVHQPNQKKGKCDFTEDKEIANRRKSQNERMFYYRGQLLHLTKGELEQLLDENHQKRPKGRDNMLDLLADIMTFGGFDHCEKCGGKSWSLNQGPGYICKKWLGRFSRCEEVSQDPPRKIFRIPEIFASSTKPKYEFLRNYAPRIERRLFSHVYEESPVRKVLNYHDLVNKPRLEKFQSNSTTVQIKGCGAVFPETDLANIAHVYQRDNEKFTATLSRSDIQNNRNTYYKMQILKADNAEIYYFCTVWGRIGTTIGDKKIQCLPVDQCIQSFKSCFLQKTGNPWVLRKVLGAQYGKFVFIDIDDDLNKVDDLVIQSNIKSNLKQSIQELMKLIFDTRIMTNTMKEYNLDISKMPLGKLSEIELHKAYAVLSQLHNHVKHGLADKAAIIEATNQFYTLVPHDCGIFNPPLLDNVGKIVEKCEMINSLIEMAIGYKILNNHTGNEENPLDAHYRCLNAKIDVVDKETWEFKMIEHYAKNTHGETHDQYELKIEEVFAVSRPDEEDTFEPYKNFPNRKLLWHGSRTTNFAGILSRGLRIAPPEAPATGYMFGKGIYFADMVTKSANYCYTSSTNSTGLLVLCEVALGNMHECLKATNIVSLPPGKHSVIGLGKHLPNPEMSFVDDDGLEIPCGDPMTVMFLEEQDLLYNEYIVYNPAQVKMKYIVRANFRYKN